MIPGVVILLKDEPDFGRDQITMPGHHTLKLSVQPKYVLVVARYMFYDQLCWHWKTSSALTIWRKLIEWILSFLNCLLHCLLISSFSCIFLRPCQQCVWVQQRESDVPIQHGGYLWPHPHAGTGGHGSCDDEYQVPEHCSWDPHRALWQGMGPVTTAPSSPCESLRCVVWRTGLFCWILRMVLIALFWDAPSGSKSHNSHMFFLK